MDGGTRVAAPEDDQYNERYPGTMLFSSFRVTQGVISDWWRIRLDGRSPRDSSPQVCPAFPGSGLSATNGNSPTVAYAADAAPGKMNMGSSFGSSWCRRWVSGRRPWIH